ncbi:MAG TPA: DUF4214 domain-containing protein [Candidatus Competibacteraceae bacterium]|nr:DUF4214 domain-containing protein [Candidatus Competibacteraceae bacterium]
MSASQSLVGHITRIGWTLSVVMMLFVSSGAVPERAWSDGALTGSSLIAGIPRIAATNVHGQQAGHLLSTTGQRQAVFWDADGALTLLGTLGGAESEALALNDVGEVVGVAQTAEGIWRGFRWTHTTGMEELATLGGQSSRALAINAAGQIVGEAQTTEGAWRAVLWDVKGLYNLGTLGGEASRALAINAAGQIAGEAQTAEGAWHAFLWEPVPGLHDLGTLGGRQSWASDLNDIGQVVGEAHTGAAAHAFLWERATGLRDLGTLGGAASRAWTITTEGRILGEAQDTAGQWQRVVWAAEDPADPTRHWLPLPAAVTMVEALQTRSITTRLAVASSAASTAFASALYTQFYGRDGDAEGIAFWADQIDACALTPAAVVMDFFQAAEFAEVVAPTARLYFAAFNRIPDGAGLDFWVRRNRAGSSLTAIAAFFVESVEFVNRYGAGLSEAAFVDVLYQNVLGRVADAQGRAFWVAALTAGRMTRGQVLLGFSESPENRAKTAAEIQVTLLYEGLIGRPPTPAELQAGRNQPLEALINALLNSSVYAGPDVPTPPCVNQPPVVDAGADQTITLPATVTLQGTITDDGLPEPPGAVTVTWTKISGPGTVTFAEATAATTTATFSATGTYILRLAADDSEQSAHDEVTITVQAAVNQPPTVSAGADQTITLPATATLQGTVTDDGLPKPPGTVTVTWTKVSGPGTVTFSNAANATTTATFSTAGAYVLRLTAEDGAVTATDDVTVIVNAGSDGGGGGGGGGGGAPVNQAPQVNAGADQTLILPTNTVTLSGTVTDDGLPNPPGAVTVGWSQISGLAGVTFANAAVASTTATFPGAGTYVLRLTANDGALTATDEVTVTVNSGGPIFQAIADCAPTGGPSPLTVRFRSQGVFSGGSIVRYRWDFEGDGTFDTSDAVPNDYTRTFTEAGAFSPVLQVTNNLGDTATDTCTLQVDNSPPTAMANASPSNGPIPLTVNFTCSGNDSDGAIVLYEWDFDGDGTFDFSSPTTGSARQIYSQVGQFTALCRVTDNEGLTGLARTTMTVIRPGEPGSPSVLASASPTSGDGPLTVALNGAATDDGAIVRWEWDFDGNGVYDFTSATSPSTSLTYDQAGVFGATLRATDNDGKIGIDNIEIVVGVNVGLSIPDDTFEPSLGESVAIHTTLNVTLPVRLLLKNRDGVVVRQLAEGLRTAGSYTDTWDGRDGAGNLLPEGPYYAVLEYDFGGGTRAFDLTDTTGGVRYNPSRNSFPNTFRPFENDPLRITFTIPESRGASEILAFVGLYNTDTRVITLLEQTPLGAGAHTIYWDGLNPDGSFAVPPPGDSFLFGIFGYTLPDNGLFLKAAPVVSNVRVDPNFFDPSTSGHPATATLTYDLDKTADVELTVTNLTTGKVLRRIQQLNVAPGAGKTIVWDGRAENGLLADAGDYRLALSAVDSTGSASMTRYALMKVFY